MRTTAIFSRQPIVLFEPRNGGVSNRDCRRVMDFDQKKRRGSTDEQDLHNQWA